MQIRIFEDKRATGWAAAEHAARTIRAALKQQPLARIVAATGASQFEFLEALTSAHGVDWSRVELFHLDEYIGLPITHPASFRKYILEKILQKTGIRRYHLLDGEHDAEAAAREVGNELSSAPADVAFVGIGENGHLAFNDPPADFAADEPYLIVELDQACRQQQVNEGWFAKISEVPETAISMSIRQILRAKEIVAVVPEARKANAVKLCLEGEITPLAPASALRGHPHATIYLDRDSSALLERSMIAASLENCGS